MDETSDPKKKIRNGEHLTFVDTVRAQFKPLVGRDNTTGQVSYPRQEYLTEVAAQRRKEAAAKRRGG